MIDIEELQSRLRQFAVDRDWGKFHSPKNLVMALSGEVGELSDIFQWLTEEESNKLDVASKGHVAEELADTLIYTLRLFDVLGVSIEEAVDRKLEINTKNYPVELSKGNATKYNKRDG